MAVKVIDKLRFPTKQESQLRNEVAILQVNARISLDFLSEEIMLMITSKSVCVGSQSFRSWSSKKLGKKATALLIQEAFCAKTTINHVSH